MKYLIYFIFIFGIFINISNSINCFVCDSKEDEHCPETWTRKDILPIECGGPDGVQDARFCIKTIAVFGGAVATKRFCSSRDMDNQCIEVKYPQDEKMYYSCTYTCSHDGCNGTSHLNISAIFVLFFILIQFFCV
ncbi:unnamed protein product [Rotaria sordida]|uniref:Protein sleepless n=1 Tax=Rotaria sordida TaxID=392033 RepID=A0A813YM15_9BILA|nr:unnamed protein product [Rotaria sordida]CAF0898863.1 unnamed protein product [Rotaria sordida]CAF3556162.1 unnamed protein product [Rotaria sordida]CAF3594127.1 unnamed protein product [Rotaria sordida]